MHPHARAHHRVCTFPWIPDPIVARELMDGTAQLTMEREWRAETLSLQNALTCGLLPDHWEPGAFFLSTVTAASAGAATLTQTLGS